MGQMLGRHLECIHSVATNFELKMLNFCTLDSQSDVALKNPGVLVFRI